MSLARIDAADYRRLELTPDTAAALDERICLSGAIAGTVFGGRTARNALRDLHAIQHLRGDPTCVLPHWRADVLLFRLFADGSGRSQPFWPGFDPRWVRWTPRRRFWRRIDELQRAGYRLGPDPHNDERAWQRVFAEAPAGKAPATYAYQVDRSIRLHALVADLANPAYRVWALGHLVAVTEVWGVREVQTTFKPGWHAHGGRDLDPQRGTGGPVLGGVYQPGEFEAACSALIVDAAALGIRFVVREKPPHVRGRITWLTREAQRLLAGELYLRFPGGQVSAP